MNDNNPRKDTTCVSCFFSAWPWSRSALPLLPSLSPRRPVMRSLVPPLVARPAAPSAFSLGGPVGAIVGGWAGAVIGGEAAVSDASIRYAGENPVDVVYLDSDLTVGAKIGDDVTIHPIEGDDQYGYIYANNRVYIIDLESHEVVQSPGYLIPNEAVSYVEANPTASISVDGDLGPGFRAERRRGPQRHPGQAGRTSTSTSTIVLRWSIPARARSSGSANGALTSVGDQAASARDRRGGLLFCPRHAGGLAKFAAPMLAMGG